MPDAVQQTKQRTLPVHYLQSQNLNNKTYFELSVIHSIFCSTSLATHLESMWLLWIFFENKKYNESIFLIS